MYSCIAQYFQECKGPNVNGLKAACEKPQGNIVNVVFYGQFLTRKVLHKFVGMFLCKMLGNMWLMRKYAVLNDVITCRKSMLCEEF